MSYSPLTKVGKVLISGIENGEEVDEQHDANIFNGKLPFKNKCK